MLQYEWQPGIVFSVDDATAEAPPIRQDTIVPTPIHQDVQAQGPNPFLVIDLDAPPLGAPQGAEDDVERHQHEDEDTPDEDQDEAPRNQGAQGAGQLPTIVETQRTANHNEEQDSGRKDNHTPGDEDDSSISSSRSDNSDSSSSTLDPEDEKRRSEEQER